jgi:hypothetical protein
MDGELPSVQNDAEAGFSQRDERCNISVLVAPEGHAHVDRNDARLGRNAGDVDTDKVWCVKRGETGS